MSFEHFRFGLDKEQESQYRQFHLQADIRLAKLLIAVLSIALTAYIYVDYAVFGSLTTMFFGILGLRLCLISVLAISYKLFSFTKTYRSYDLKATALTLILLVAGAFIDMTRRPDFVLQATSAVITIFVIFLVVPNNFANQILLSITVIAGDLIIAATVFNLLNSHTLSMIALTFVASGIIASASSWQLHNFRPKNFLDLLRRNKLQEKLEQHSKNLEKLVADRTEELKTAERFATIGTVAGMVGHDIRNPLAAINGYVYIANKKLNDETAVKNSLDMIKEQTVYIEKIVADLQDYSRSLKPTFQTTNLEELIQSVKSTLKIPHNVTFSLRIEKGFPKILTDQTYLRRMLTNLSNNAMQAMPSGGTLAIDACVQDKMALISVEDSGEGIPLEFREKIFTPLFTTKSRGQGLGLAVVKRLVEALGGNVFFKTELGKGTKFTIVIPILS